MSCDFKPNKEESGIEVLSIMCLSESGFWTHIGDENLKMSQLGFFCEQGIVFRLRFYHLVLFLFQKRKTTHG